MTVKNYKMLESHGWVELYNYSTNEELLKLASSLGQPALHPNGEYIFKLKPKKNSEAIKGTFSNRYGFDEFPLHTDTAFYAQPIRLMLLHSERPSATATKILSIEKIFKFWNNEDIEDALRAIYLVKTIERRFFTSFIFSQNGARCIKYDPTCMIPFNKFAKNIDLKLREVLRFLKPTEISWTNKKTVIIHNWKTLHGRSSVIHDTERELKRIYIY